MGTAVRVSPGIAAEWPALAADGPLLASPTWLRVRRASFGNQMISIVVTQDGQAKLAALGTVVREPRPDEFYDLHFAVAGPAPVLPLTEAARAARAELARTAPPPERWVPNLIVTLPGNECVPVGPGRGDPALLGELVGGALTWAEQENLPTVAFMFTHADPPGLDLALAGHGFTAIPLSRSWVLPVPPGGLDAYLAALPAKRRREASRELRRLADTGVSVRQLDLGELEAEGTLAALATLRARLVRKYRGKADDLRELGKLQRLITDVCGGQPKVFVAEADGDLLGFSLFCAHGDCWYALVNGYDYADERSRFCYFATIFYAPMPIAADSGVRSLAFGHGSGGAKKSRGAAGLPLTGWIKSADPELSAAAAASAKVTALEPG